MKFMRVNDNNFTGIDNNMNIKIVEKHICGFLKYDVRVNESCYGEYKQWCIAEKVALNIIERLGGEIV